MVLKFNLPDQDHYQSVQNTTYGLHIDTQSSVFSGEIGKTIYYQSGILTTTPVEFVILTKTDAFCRNDLDTAV